MASRSSRVERDGAPFNAAWAVDAPWAHPAWSQYAVALYDLTTPYQGVTPHLARPGMTHEVMIWAVNPDKPIPASWPANMDDRPGLLDPANYGYQFAAASHDAAFARIQALVDQIDQKLLSPDTDFRSVWDGIFADGVSLHHNVFEEIDAQHAVRH